MHKILTPLFAGLSMIWILILLPIFIFLRGPSIDLGGSWTHANSFSVPQCGTIPRPAWLEKSSEAPAESAIVHHKGFPFAYQRYSQVGNCAKSPEQSNTSRYVDVGLALAIGVFLGYLTSRRNIFKT